MNNLKLPVLVVSALAALGGFVWIVQTYLPSSDAAVSKVNIQVVQPNRAPQTIVPMGKQIDFIVSPETSTDRISGVDLVVDVEGGTLNSWENCTSLDTTSTYPFTELINKTGAKARYSCVVIKDKDQLPPNVVLSGAVGCTGEGSAKVTISNATQVSGPVEGTTYELGTLGTAEVACDGTGGGGGDDNARNEDFIASFSPKECRSGISCSYSLKIAANKNSKRISGVYVKLGYDGDILRLNTPEGNKVLGATTTSFGSTLLAQGATPGPAVTGNPTAAPVSPTSFPSTTPSATPAPSGVVTGTPSPSSSPSASPTQMPRPTGGAIPEGTCSYVASEVFKDGAGYMYLCNMPASQLSTSATLELNFDVVGSGKGVLSIDAIQVVGPDAVGPYTVYKGKATYNTGKTGKGNIQLDMKLRFQCVPKKPKGAQELEVKVGLGDGGLRKAVYETATFKVDDDGFWRGSVSFNAPAGPGYKLLPKGDKHMQKKVCVNNPTEDFPGAYSCDKGQINLRDGKNEIDLTKIVLLTGDLPPGEQDGISNAKDQSLVRNLVGKRDEESAVLADINFDGVVNAVDHSCMIAALSVRWDEE